MEKAIKRYMPIFVLPTFCAFILGFIIPFVMGIWLSFCKFTTVTDAKFVGLSNYIEAFKDTVFRHSFWYTALFAVVSLVVINVIAFALAMALTQKMRGTNIFRTIFFMPNLIGGIVLGYIWQLIFNGVLAHYSTALGLNEWYGFWGLIILVSWQQIGYMMIIYIAGLQSIPGDVMEAAQIDGASRIQRLFKVTIPMMMPSIIQFIECLDHIFLIFIACRGVHDQDDRDGHLLPACFFLCLPSRAACGCHGEKQGNRCRLYDSSFKSVSVPAHMPPARLPGEF